MEEIANRLAAALAQREDVVFAYLFGSQASGRTHKRSDVDVAVWIRAPYDATARDPLLEIIGLASTALGRNDVDVLLLNEAPLWIAARALRGKLLLDRDEALRVREEARIMSRYHDRLPYYRRHLEKEATNLAERGFS